MIFCLINKIKTIFLNNDLLIYLYFKMNNDFEINPILKKVIKIIENSILLLFSFFHFY